MAKEKLNLIRQLLKSKHFFVVSIDEETGNYEYSFFGNDQKLYNLYFHLCASYIPGWLKKWKKQNESKEKEK